MEHEHAQGNEMSLLSQTVKRWRELGGIVALDGAGNQQVVTASEDEATLRAAQWMYYLLTDDAKKALDAHEKQFDELFRPETLPPEAASASLAPSLPAPLAPPGPGGNSSASEPGGELSFPIDTNTGSIKFGCQK